MLISRHGIGYNNIDLDRKTARDNCFHHPTLVERDAVAENNVTNLLAVLRQTVAADAALKQINGKTSEFCRSDVI